MEKILYYINEGKKEGAKLVTGGKRIGRDGYFVEPTIFADVGPNMKIFREEVSLKESEEPNSRRKMAEFRMKWLLKFLGFTEFKFNAQPYFNFITHISIPF